MKLRARWIGPAPRVGDYLMSGRRPRFAYRISRVRPTLPNVCWDPAAKAEVHFLQFVVAKIAVTAVPRNVRIHSWRWDRREAMYGARQLNVHGQLLQHA